MKIAFATNDRKTLADRTGQAKEFVIYEISGTDIIKTDYFTNTHEHHDGDSHNHSHKEITEILKGIDYFYVTKVGKHMKHDLEEAKINYVKTEKKEIKDILDPHIQ
jgi:predicted Fe-Mo cluster-binding NifX family protein